MKPRKLVLGALVMALLIGCAPVTSQGLSQSGPSAAEASSTTRGVVLSVERPRPEDSQAFVHVVITPAEERPIRLVLAPGWYLEERGLRLEPQQAVEVRGRHVVQDGEPSIIVQSVRQGERSYILRDEREQPAWLKP
jgi:hypothetical protein